MSDQMAIDANKRKAMAAGMRLTAKYKKEEHTAEVIAREEGKLGYRLADGREFKSPSAAGSAVMGGVACNGWRFWTVAADEAKSPPAARQSSGKTKTASHPGKKRTAAKPAATEPTEGTAEAGTPHTEECRAN